jgi:alkylation response protein AidB-like acyl-CoA dehydrogenase
VDFSSTQAQEELSSLSRRILTDHATPQRLAELEAAGDRHDAALWADLAAAGVLSAALPEPAGGAGYGLAEQCSILTEIGRAVAPVPYLASIVLGAGAIAEFGTDEQIARWATPAGAGELILTAALAEPDGDDPAAPSTTAERTATGWLLNGTKTTVPAAARAALILVPAATSDGLAVLLVQPSDPGVTIRPQQLVDGGGSAQLELTAVVLPADRVLGPAPGIDPSGSGSGPRSTEHAGRTGADVTGWLAARGTVGLCAQQLGVTERALELTAEYAKSRDQFGRPIGAFQAVAQRLADAYIDVQGIRLTLWQAAWRLAAGLPCGTEIATAKFWAADAGHRVAHTAVHIHGGVGIDTSYPLHRYFTAAKANEFALGGATAQLRRIGAALAQA